MHPVYLPDLSERISTEVQEETEGHYNSLLTFYQQIVDNFLPGTEIYMLENLT